MMRDGLRWPAAVSLALLVLLQSLLFAGLLVQRDFALVDDAYISFRYASRWADGQGLTFNDGESVEGFSNPLWTLLLGTAAKLGWAPHRSVLVLAGVCVLATTVTLVALARARGFGPAASGLLLAGVGLDLGMLLWSGSGLEPPLGTLLVSAWLLVAATPLGFARAVALGVLGALLTLTRPEGLLWALWGLAWLIWGAWAPRRVLGGWILGMVPALAYVIFRMVAFHRAVPNPFFAKLEPSFLAWGYGAQDLGVWALGHLPFLILGVGLLFRGRWRSTPVRAPKRWLLLPAGWVVLQMLFVLLVGGDWMGRHRYLVPVLPALFLVLAEVVHGRQGSPRRLGLAVAAAVAVQLVMGWASRDRIPDYTRVGEELGAWLGSVASPQDTLAVSAAGAIPYFSGLTTYDVLGVNDASVAGRPPRHDDPWAPGHHRYDIDALVALRPTWIVWDFGVKVNAHRLRRLRDSEEGPRTLGFRRALLAHPEFQKAYVIDYGAPPQTQRAYTVFRRKVP
jgi:hypothetical protein